MLRGRFVVMTIGALYFGIIFGLAFVPESATNREVWYWPFSAFVPVGVLLLLMLGRRRWWVSIVFGLLGAAWIEAGQTVWMPAGYASALDVVWAGAGTVVGVALAWFFTSLEPRSMRSHQSPRMIAHASETEITQD
jgi:hypothetical protein